MAAPSRLYIGLSITPDPDKYAVTVAIAPDIESIEETRKERDDHHPEFRIFEIKKGGVFTEMKAWLLELGLSDEDASEVSIMAKQDIQLAEEIGSEQ